MLARLYFFVGDLLANAAVGAGLAWLVGVVVPQSWPMLPAMVLGMGLGMVLSVPGAFLFVPLFGALEVMLPVMVTGMTAGMIAAMRVTAGESAGLLVLGGAIGIAVALATHLLNLAIGGPQPLPRAGTAAGRGED